ncbi:YciI family protein [Mesorhizobium sp. CC13]|uniref:YciI family protein n=1 Tax=Mesorhizobium sp. CC13 TaxID=3029194 RepID=UPI0032649807
MRFMFVVKASKDSEAGIMPSTELISAMADYHEELAKAGVLLDGSGLQPSSRGWRITWSGGRKTVTDGPFAETKELIAGYTIIQVKTREEAMEWANRFPNPQMENGQIEVRQMFDLEDFEPSEGIDRFRDMGIAQDRK